MPAPGQAPRRGGGTAMAATPTLLMFLALSAAANLPRSVDAVTARPDRPPVSVPLDAATIKWMSQFVSPDTTGDARYGWPFNSPGFLPFSDSRIRKTVTGCEPEQVHLGYWSAPEHVAEAGGGLTVLLSYTTCDSTFGENGPAGPLPTAGARTEVWLRSDRGRANRLYTRKVTGTAYSYENTWQYTDKDPKVTYTSPLIHHVLLKNLSPGKRVDYAIPYLPQPQADDLLGPGRRLAQQQQAADNVTAMYAPASSSSLPSSRRGHQDKNRQFPAGTYYGSFIVPRRTFPFKIGAVGDAGQMDPNSTVALQNLVGMRPDLVLSMGDNAYHDDTGTKKDDDGVKVQEFPNFMKPADVKYSDMVGFYSPRWESMHRLYSALFSRVPVIQTPGNHELCPEPFPNKGKFATVQSFLARFKDYNAYWPSPQRTELTRDGPTPETLQPVGPVPTVEMPETGMQNRNQFHAHTIPGIATIISLSNYILWESYGVEQLEWLKAQLAAVDRAKTPWLIVIWHSSWYSTFSKHWRETECMRRAYEPTFRAFKVDFVLNGHNHGYERTKPMYNGRVDDSGCGTVHLMLGGGCADDLTFGYIDEEESMPFLPLKPGTCKTVDDTVTGKVCPYVYCADPEKFHIPGYQAADKYEKAPACALPNTEHPAPLCPEHPPGSPPPYSAYRQSTYGVGSLELLSATKARWSWYANNLNKNGPKSVTDSVILTRDPALTCS